MMQRSCSSVGAPARVAPPEDEITSLKRISAQAMLSLAYALQQVSNALVVGSFYSLLAVSYALVHGLTNRIVLSFGDMAMFAAFCAAYGALIAFSLGIEAGAAMIIAMAAAALCSAALGRFAYGSVFAPLLGVRNQALLIASAGLGLVIQEVMRLQSHGREQWLEPILNSPLLEMADGHFALRITTIQALIVAGTLCLIGCLFAVLRLTRLGRLWRACSQDRALSLLLGVDVRLVTATAFVLAAVFAGAAGFHARHLLWRRQLQHGSHAGTQGAVRFDDRRFRHHSRCGRRSVCAGGAGNRMDDVLLYRLPRRCGVRSRSRAADGAPGGTARRNTQIGQRSMKRSVLMLVLGLLLAGCGDDSSKPYLTVAGGGFIFNYRIAESYYGIVVKVERKLPKGALLMAEFEDPAGGPPIILREPVIEGRLRYSLRSPPLKGIRKDVPYKIAVVLREGEAGKVLERVERTFRSQVDQTIMPQKPLVLGPGYQINPENDITKPAAPQ